MSVVTPFYAMILLL